MSSSFLPQVSVIIPTYNGRKFIERSVDSVLGQTFTDFELIIIDDASPDDTLSFVKKKYGYKKNVKIVSLKKNLGPGGARNEGIKLARGKYVAFLDHDDEWHLQYLDTQVKSLEHYPNAVLSHCNFYLFDHSNNRIFTVDMPWGFSNHPVESLLLSYPICSMSFVVIPRRFLNKVGPIADYRIVHDLDLYLKLGMLGKFVHVNKYLVDHHRGVGNTGDDLNCLKNEWLNLIDKFCFENPNYEGLRIRAKVKTLHHMLQNQKYHDASNAELINKLLMQSFSYSFFYTVKNAELSIIQLMNYINFRPLKPFIALRNLIETNKKSEKVFWRLAVLCKYNVWKIISKLLIR